MSTHTTTSRRTRALAGASTLALLGSLALVAPTAAYAEDTAPPADTTPTGPTTTPAPTGDGTTGCSTGSLPDSITGRPTDFRAGLARGYWIWHDTTGWHLRVTHAGSAKLVFSGAIRTTNPATSHRVMAEKRDRIARSADGRTTTFRFTNYGKVDGLNFKAACSARVSFTLLVNGKPIAPSRIHLGDDHSHPAKAVFAIDRIASTV